MKKKSSVFYKSALKKNSFYLYSKLAKTSISPDADDDYYKFGFVHRHDDILDYPAWLILTYIALILSGILTLGLHYIILSKIIAIIVGILGILNLWYHLTIHGD